MINTRRTSSDISVAVLVYGVAIGVVVVSYGCLLNDNHHKYAKYHSSTCEKGIFIRDVDNSHFCCDDMYHRSDWVCVAAYDKVNAVWSSLLAWVVPLLPISLTILTDFFTGQLEENKHTQLRRVLFYIGLFVYRTTILYFLGGLIELNIQKEEAKMQSCWYSELTGGMCRNHFDYSDHSILHLTHFLLPATLEVVYILHNRCTSVSQLYYLPLIASAAISLLTYRCMLFSSMYFHTNAEMAVSLKIFFVLILLPLYFGRNTQVFRLCFEGK